MVDKYMHLPGPPPAYPPSAYAQPHDDAGPYPGQDPHQPHFYHQQPAPQPASADYYGNAQGPHGQYPPAPQGYYGPPPAPGMTYQQPPAAPPAPINGHFADGRGSRGGRTGLCAAIAAAFACCCCLDIIF